MASTFSLMGKLGLDARDFQKGAKQAENAIDGVSDKMDDLPDQAGQQGSKAGGMLSSNLAKGFLLAGGAAALTAGFKSVVDAASNLEESTNAVGVAFGDAGAEVLAFGEDSARAYGLSQSAFNDAAVGFSAFAETIAGSGGDTAQTLESLIARSTDFASVMNMEVPEAADAFRSALSGEAEPLKRFGINVSDAAVTAYALETGLVATAGAMTEGIKVQARYGLLMRETDKFAGDFANTSDGLANSQKVLSAELENFQAAIGGKMLPTLADYVGIASDLLSTATALSELRFSDALDDFAPSLETIVEKGTSFMTLGLSDVLDHVGLSMDGLGDSVHDAANGFGLWGDTVAESAAKAEVAARINDNEYSTSIDKVADSVRMAEHENGQYSLAQDLVTQSIEDAISAHRDETEAILSKTAANRSATDAAYAARDAEDRYQDSLVDTTAALQDSDLTEREKAAAVRDSVRALDDMVLAQLEEQGVSADSVLGQQMWKESMELSAQFLSGPLRDEVDSYIGRIGAIPTGTTTDIDVNTSRADQVLAEWMARPRALRIDAYTTTQRGSDIFRADGGPVSGGGGYIVGERGPEWFQPNSDGHVFTAAQTAAMFAHSVAAPSPRPMPSGGSPTFANGSALTINHYGPNLSAADVSRGYTLARLAQVA